MMTLETIEFIKINVTDLFTNIFNNNDFKKELNNIFYF